MAIAAGQGAFLLVKRRYTQAGFASIREACKQEVCVTGSAKLPSSPSAQGPLVSTCSPGPPTPEIILAPGQVFSEAVSGAHLLGWGSVLIPLSAAPGPQARLSV